MTDIIRDAQDADAEALIELIGDCWREYPGVVFDVDRELPELRAIASHFAALGGRFWVAPADARLVGSAGVVPVADGMELHKLYVARGARRKGLASRLVALVESEARARGAAVLYSWSDSRFTASHRLYQRLGFIRDGEAREVDDLSRSTEIHFVKRLSGP